MLKKVHLDYPLQMFLSGNYDSHEGSCIKHQVYELTDIHEQFGGFPESYCYENTRINQLWYEPDQVDFAEIGRQLGMDVVSISSIRQHPGCVIPWHRDTFYQISKRWPDRNELKVRANIYLQDWRMGHIIQYNDTIDTHWSAGDGWLWDSSILHLGANVGMQDKFTLQISGFLID